MMKHTKKYISKIIVICLIANILFSLSYADENATNKMAVKTLKIIADEAAQKRQYNGWVSIALGVTGIVIGNIAYNASRNESGVVYLAAGLESTCGIVMEILGIFGLFYGGHTLLLKKSYIEKGYEEIMQLPDKEKESHADLYLKMLGENKKNYFWNFFSFLDYDDVNEEKINGYLVLQKNNQ